MSNDHDCDDPKCPIHGKGTDLEKLMTKAEIPDEAFDFLNGIWQAMDKFVSTAREKEVDEVMITQYGVAMLARALGCTLGNLQDHPQIQMACTIVARKNTVAGIRHMEEGICEDLRCPFHDHRTTDGVH